jgi:hypothetical protein
LSQESESRDPLIEVFIEWLKTLDLRMVHIFLHEQNGDVYVASALNGHVISVVDTADMYGERPYDEGFLVWSYTILDLVQTEISKMTTLPWPSLVRASTSAKIEGFKPGYFKCGYVDEDEAWVLSADLERPR